MIKNYENLIIFKNWEFILGLIISLCAHILLFTVFEFKNDNLYGDKFIPIELIDLDNSYNIGDSLDESLTENIKDNSEFTDDKLINELEETIDNIEKQIKQEENTKNQNLTNNINLKKQFRGIINGEKDQDIEKGSLLGKGAERITCLNCVTPKYPKLAIKRDYEGTLKLKVTIQKNGSVKNVLITESSGYKILDESGIKAAQDSKFHPIRKQTELNIIHDFKLN